MTPEKIEALLHKVLGECGAWFPYKYSTLRSMGDATGELRNVLGLHTGDLGAELNLTEEEADYVRSFIAQSRARQHPRATS